MTKKQTEMMILIQDLVLAFVINSAATILNGGFTETSVYLVGMFEAFSINYIAGLIIPVERIGRAVGRAFDGDVRYDFSHENKLARVHWLEGGDGGTEQALSLFEAALAIRRRVGPARSVAETLGMIANIRIQHADLAAAAVALEDARARWKDAGDLPGEARDVVFTLDPGKDLRHYDEQAQAYAVVPGEYELQVGASSADIRARTRLAVEQD